MSAPTEEQWKQIADRFWSKWQFPNCLGAIDGKHVIIQALPNSGTIFYNYKGSFSIVLMALASADYSFVMVDVGVFSSQSDGGIFKKNTFLLQIRQGGTEYSYSHHTAC